MEYAAETMANRRTSDDATRQIAQEAKAAMRRLGVHCVTQTPSGEWREAAPWQGTRAKTLTLDCMIRLRKAEEPLRPSDGQRRRRLRLALLELELAGGAR